MEEQFIPSSNPDHYDLQKREPHLKPSAFEHVSDYIEYVRKYEPYMSVTDEMDFYNHHPEILFEFLIYHLVKGNQSVFFDLPLETGTVELSGELMCSARTAVNGGVSLNDRQFIEAVYLTPVSGSIFKILDREMVMIGIQMDHTLVMYEPGKYGLMVLNAKYQDLSLPAHKTGIQFISGENLSVDLMLENRQFLFYVLNNKTVHNRWSIGHKIYNELIDSKFADAVIYCSDYKIPFVKSAVSGMYFFAYFTSEAFGFDRKGNQWFKTRYEFLAPSYLLQDYLHFHMTSEHKYIDRIVDNAEEFLKFAVYLQDYEYLYCLVRLFEYHENFDSQEIFDFVSDLLLLPETTNVLDYLSEKYSVEQQKLKTNYLQSLYKTKPFNGSLTCIDGSVDVNLMQIAHQSPYLYYAILNKKKVEASSKYILEYQKYVFHMEMDKHFLIQNIFQVLEFAEMIEDYQFMKEVINVFFTEPQTNFYARQDINQYLKEMKKRMEETEKQNVPCDV